MSRKLKRGPVSFVLILGRCRYWAKCRAMLAKTSGAKKDRACVQQGELVACAFVCTHYTWTRSLCPKLKAILVASLETIWGNGRGQSCSRRRCEQTVVNAMVHFRRHNLGSVPKLSMLRASGVNGGSGSPDQHHEKQEERAAGPAEGAPRGGGLLWIRSSRSSA